MHSFSLESDSHFFSHQLMKSDSENWCPFRNYLVQPPLGTGKKNET